MLNIRNSFLRESVIDECLRGSRPMSAKEIMARVNIHLANHLEKPITDSKTIVRDIHSIRDRWKVKIIENKIGRVVYYHYEDSNFSIYNAKYTKDMMEKLYHALDYISDYVGLPHVEWLNEVKAMLYANSNDGKIEHQPIVCISHNSAYNVHLRHFAPLFDLIKAKSAIELTYQKFNSEAPSTRIFHPYHLKEFQNRWYLVGWCREHSDHLSCFGLERIISYEKSDAPFVENPGFDVEEYFGAMVGLTIPEGAKPQDVEIWVEDKDCPYVESNPIHQSQRYVRDENGGKVYALHLFLNYELEMRLLAYGERLRVLAPDGFRKRMRERTLAMAKLYDEEPKGHFVV